MNDPESAEPRGWLFLALGALIVAGVYAPTLGAPFLWDDLLLIAESPRIRTLDFATTFLRPFWLGGYGNEATGIYFRPLTTLSYQLDFQLHGDNPAGYHLTNVAWHLVGTSLLFALLRRRGASVALSFVLTLVWALAPRLTEGVAWVSGRTDVLCAVFVFVALLVHRPGRPRRLALAGLAALAAVLCKEAGLAAFVALALLEADSSRRGAVLPTRSWRWLLLAVPLLGYMTLRLVAGAVSTGEGVPLSLAARALTVLEALGRYAFMLLNPFQPRSLIGQVFAPSLRFVLGGAVVLLVAAGAGLKWGRPRLSTAAYASLAVLPLLMVLQLVALPATVVASDRYLYLPLAGILLTAAPWLSAAVAAQPRLMLAPLLLALACGARTASRVADYADTTRFWLVAAEHAPTHPEALSALGSVAYRAGLWDEAFTLYARGAALHGEASIVVLDNAALVAMMQGKRGLAAKLGDELVARKPDASYALRRGTIAFNALELDEAERYARRSLELNPTLGLSRDLLRLVGRAKELAPAIDSGAASASTRLLRDVSALRYPEVVAELRREDAPRTLRAASIQQALGFVVAKGRPEDARELLKRFGAALSPQDFERLAAGVALRLQTADEARPRLRAFLAEPQD